MVVRPKINAIDIGPQPGPQTQLLQSTADIVLFGGAAGGGKSYGLLLDFLRHYDNSNAGCVFFRRTYSQIKSEGGLWDSATDLYTRLNAKTKDHPPTITCPSGANMNFSHLQHNKNIYDWQGSQIPVIYFDELTHFTEKMFFYLLSRNRSTSGIKPYVRCTSNPDSESWVRDFIDWYIGEDGLPILDRCGVIRYFYRVDERIVWSSSKEELMNSYPNISKIVEPKSFTFIPSSLDDNQILMKKDPSYKANLMALNKVDRERLLFGNWNVRPTSGSYFKRYYFEEVDALPQLVRVIRCWDRAATEWKEGDPGDPDYTASVKMGVDKNNRFFILDVTKDRLSAHKVEQLIKNTAIQDGINVAVKGFQDPGGAGKGEIENFIRMLAGFNVITEKVVKDKQTLAKPASAQAEAGNIKVLSTCRNKEALYLELENFPEGAHDDIIDALTGAFNSLSLPDSGNWTKDMSDFEDIELNINMDW